MYKTLSAMKFQFTLSDCGPTAQRELSCWWFRNARSMFSPKLLNSKLWYTLNASLSGDLPQQWFSESKILNLFPQGYRRRNFVLLWDRFKMVLDNKYPRSRLTDRRRTASAQEQHWWLMSKEERASVSSRHKTPVFSSKYKQMLKK